MGRSLYLLGKHRGAIEAGSLASLSYRLFVQTLLAANCYKYMFTCDSEPRCSLFRGEAERCQRNNTFMVERLDELRPRHFQQRSLLCSCYGIIANLPLYRIAPLLCNGSCEGLTLPERHGLDSEACGRCMTKHRRFLLKTGRSGTTKARKLSLGGEGT